MRSPSLRVRSADADSAVAPSPYAGFALTPANLSQGCDHWGLLRCRAFGHTPTRPTVDVPGTDGVRRSASQLRPGPLPLRVAVTVALGAAHDEASAPADRKTILWSHHLLHSVLWVEILGGDYGRTIIVIIYCITSHGCTALSQAFAEPETFDAHPIAPDSTLSQSEAGSRSSVVRSKDESRSNRQPTVGRSNRKKYCAAALLPW